jgi:hypothetical protein
LGKDSLQNAVELLHHLGHRVIGHARAEGGYKAAERIDIHAMHRRTVHSFTRKVEPALLFSDTVNKHNFSPASPIRRAPVRWGYHVPQRRLNRSHNEVETEIDQVNASQGENQVPANNDTCIKDVIDQIDERKVRGFVAAKENNLRSPFRHEVLA